MKCSIVPTRIVLLNRIVHLNTVNRIFRNWTITSFKIQQSPDFRKQRCDERTIWFDPYCPLKGFSTVFFKGWNSWIQLLFYFFLEHHKETLKKEQYNLIHVIKSTHGLACIAFSNICSRLWSGDNTVWRILSIKEIFQGFIQAYNLLLLQRFLKKFNHGQYSLTHIVLSKKWSNCIVLLKIFTRLYVLNHIVLSSILDKFPQKALFFSLFSWKAVFFFSIYTILNKFGSGTQVDPYCPF